MSSAVSAFVYTLCVIPILYYLYSQVKEMLEEIERRGERIRHLSNMLQIAEYESHVPYYTSLGHNQLPMEHSDWLYKHMRERLLRQQEGTE